MGFFSFKTQDTDRSISNNHSSRGTFLVYLMDDKGNKWSESNYEGYGVFSGMDFFELLAEMNGYGEGRERGIDLYFSGETIKFPNIVESKDWQWKNEKPEECEYQGYFY